MNENEIRAVRMFRYESVALLRSFQCHNCQMLYIVPPNVNLWKRNPVELQGVAKDVHLDAVRKNNTLCASPKLIITWDNTYIFRELLK